MVIPGKIYIKAKTDILNKQVFVIYLSSLDLPPHSELTNLDQIKGLKLIPTPCPTHQTKEDLDNKKDIIHSAIGLPPCSVSINTSSSEDEDHEVTPHLLITTQTKLKPSRSPLPTIKQTIIKPILKSTSNQPCEDLNDDDQELFITGDIGLRSHLTINLLPDLLINDPFNHDLESQITLDQLSFSVIPTTLTSSLRLLASFTREDQQEEEEEQQAWDITFQSSKLSNGILGLESLSTPNLISSTDILRGPYEWVFNRISNRKIVKSGCILIFIKKIKKKKRGRKDRSSEARRRIGYECWILNGHDLSTIDIKPLDNLKSIENNQICLSYHGVYCYSIDVNGVVRPSPLVSPNQSSTIVGLLVNGIQNWESVEDISRLLSSSSSASCLTTTRTPGEEVQLECMYIFRDVGTFIGLLSPSNHNFEFNPHLATSWNLGFDLWSSIPQCQKAADIALICCQLCVALGIVDMVKANHYSGLVWHMIGLSRWYSRLCQRIVSSIDPDSETPHLSLLPKSGCLFYFCFKIMVALTNFSNWLKAANPHQQPRLSQPTHAFASSNPNTDNFYQHETDTSFAICDEDQVENEIAKTVFAEVWNHQNHIHMKSWGKLLQDLGRTVYPKPGIGVTSLPPCQGQGFTLPLSAVDPVQCITPHPMLIKPDCPSTSSDCPSPSNTLTDVQPPASTLAPLTSPMGPSTTPTTSPPSVPPRTTGEEELIANDKPREEEPLFDHKTLATLKTINRTIKAVDDQAKYDVLVGINLSELLDSDQTNPILDSATTKRTLDGALKSNYVSTDQLVKECTLV
ncbi:hypothetical protein PSTT_06955 [Puccinia striiformis]|uniref:Uncharacterized protein n=1 Tax=Puccinia striiformis TaxID=27350 RepID=A0A2S4VIA8_9BASI|nr:hypothetical protein PSTT_06955 [Puccinia striiformis]